MKELLLADAHQLSASPSEYEATRQQIDSVAYEMFTLDEVDFYDLVFMEANNNVWADNQKLVDTLTPKGQVAHAERSRRQNSEGISVRESYQSF